MQSQILHLRFIFFNSSDQCWRPNRNHNRGKEMRELEGFDMGHPRRQWARVRCRGPVRCAAGAALFWREKTPLDMVIDNDRDGRLWIRTVLVLHHNIDTLQSDSVQYALMYSLSMLTFYSHADFHFIDIWATILHEPFVHVVNIVYPFLVNMKWDRQNNNWFCCYCSLNSTILTERFREMYPVRHYDT